MSVCLLFQVPNCEHTQEHTHTHTRHKERKERRKKERKKEKGNRGPGKEENKLVPTLPEQSQEPHLAHSECHTLSWGGAPGRMLSSASPRTNQKYNYMWNNYY